MSSKSPVRGAVIGLCGRSGSGKTTVCRAFEKLGIMSVDTDRVYRDLVTPAADGTPSELVREIAREFGDCVISPDGSLNRAALAGAVFGEGNSDRLRTLNRITHQPILRRTAEMIDDYFAAGASGVIVDAPALFESGFHEKCHAIMCVSAPDEVLVERIMARDGISEDAAMRRLSSQIGDAQLRARADYVIVNSGDEDLEAQAEEITAEILTQMGEFTANEE